MVYTRTWNAAYEASPDGSDLGSTLDNRIREMKSDIRERMSADHYMLISGTDADHGQHNKVTLRAAAYAGSGTADKAIIHAVNVDAKARPCYTDEDGNLLRMVALPGGNTTFMMFWQNAAPLGWTRDTTDHDAFLRVVSSGGGGSGGSASAATLAHTHTMGTHSHTMGTHNHQWYNYTGGTDQTYNSAGTATNLTQATHAVGLDVVSSAGALNFDGYTTKVDPGNTETVDPGDTDNTNINPKYINVLVASVD